MEMEGLDPRVISNSITEEDNISPTEEVLKEEIQAQADIVADKIRTDSVTSKSVGDMQRNSAVLKDDE